MEAPNRGAYLVNTPPGYNHTRLANIDSLGRLQWQRTYFRAGNTNFLFDRPAYTIWGNLLLTALSTDLSGTRGVVLEVNQRGDSLTSRTILNFPGRTSQLTGVRRLRDGGFFLIEQVDTAIGLGSFSRMAFARLDANLNVLWTNVYRPLSTRGFTDLSRGGLELADDSLLTVVAVFNNPVIHLLRLSATGTLLNDYSYQSSHPSSALNESLTPLAADSSFVLAGNTTNVYSTDIDHFRIPGLRRVLPEPPLPPVQVLATRAPVAFPTPAFPNPARELVTVPLRPQLAPARLLLRDLAGRLVLAQPVVARAASATVGVSGLAPGVYLLTLEAPGQPPATQRLAIGP